MPIVAPFQKQCSAQRIVTEQKHKEQAHKNSSLWPLDLLPLGLAHPVSNSSTKGELSDRLSEITDLYIYISPSWTQEKPTRCFIVFVEKWCYKKEREGDVPHGILDGISSAIVSE